MQENDMRPTSGQIFLTIYPNEYGKQGWIVFDSMINLRPSWGNKSRGVDDVKIQEKIRTIVNKLVKV